MALILSRVLPGRFQGINTHFGLNFLCTAPPIPSCMAGDAEVEPRTVATLVLTVRCSRYSVRPPGNCVKFRSSMVAIVVQKTWLNNVSCCIIVLYNC